jgi:exosortase
MVENPVIDSPVVDELGADPISPSPEPPKQPARAVWIGIGSLAVLFCLSYAHLFMYFWQRWTEEHGPFGYGYFVPPSVIYLLWANRNQIKTAPVTPTKAAGWVAVGVLVLMQLVGIISGVTIIQSFTFVGLLLALPYCIWGPERFKVLWAPLLYTAAMIPWPGQISNILLFDMQQISIKMADKFFSMLGMMPEVDGPTVNLPHYSFDVAPACAGLTILFPTVACAILTVMMLEAQLWRKLLYVGLSIPISILTNGGRISLVGIIGNQGGTELAAKLHDASGFFGVVICVIILSMIGSLIGCSKYKDQYMPAWAKEPEEEEKEKESDGDSDGTKTEEGD